MNKYEFVCLFLIHRNGLHYVKLLIHMINVQCVSYVTTKSVYHNHGLSNFYNDIKNKAFNKFNYHFTNGSRGRHKDFHLNSNYIEV